MVLSAVLLVVAFALATAGPVDLPLELLLVRISPTLSTALRTALPTWIADHVVLPMLLRPAWLIPLGLGLLCAAGAATFPARNSISRTRMH